MRILEEDNAITYQSVNLYDRKNLKTFEALTDQPLETTLEAAASCFETWRNTTFTTWARPWWQKPPQLEAGPPAGAYTNLLISYD